MGKKKNKKEQVSPGLYFWLPASIFAAIPLWEIIASMSESNYVNQAALVHHQTLYGLGMACWLAAGALLVFAPLRRNAVAHLDKLALAPAWARRLWPALSAAGFAGLIFWIKFCQYRGFQLPQDSATMAHTAFNTLHGRWFEAVSEGTPNVLATHFAFTLSLLSPILLIWRSTLALILLQCLAIASMGLGVYWLVYRRSASSYAGFLGMLLVYSHPSFYQLSTASLENSVFAAAFFLWAMYFMEERRWIGCLAFLFLAVSTREAFPFTLAGLGLYLMFKDGKPSRAGMVRGGALVIGSALLWAAEMKLVNSFPVVHGEYYWLAYSRFGADKKEIIHFVLTHPVQTLWKMVYPFPRLRPLGELFAHAALLPLAAPAKLLIFAAAAAPQLLMNSYSLDLQYATYMLGPMMFAAAHGLGNVLRWLGDGKRRGYLLAPVLAVSGFGFRGATPTLMYNWHPDWFDAVPGLIEKIPQDASLWCEQFTSAWVACRPQLKFDNDSHGEFTNLLFRPEYALMYKGWFFYAEPSMRAKVLEFLFENRYVKIGDAADMILLRDPAAPRAPERSPALKLPEPAPDPRLAQAYLRYLLGGPVSP